MEVNRAYHSNSRNLEWTFSLNPNQSEKENFITITFYNNYKTINNKKAYIGTGNLTFKGSLTIFSFLTKQSNGLSSRIFEKNTRLSSIRL